MFLGIFQRSDYFSSAPWLYVCNCSHEKWSLMLCGLFNYSIQHVLILCHITITNFGI